MVTGGGKRLQNCGWWKRIRAHATAQAPREVGRTMRFRSSTFKECADVNHRVIQVQDRSVTVTEDVSVQL